MKASELLGVLAKEPYSNEALLQERPGYLWSVVIFAIPQVRHVSWRDNIYICMYIHVYTYSHTYIYMYITYIHKYYMMMIAFITFKSSLVPLLEGL